LFITFEGIDGCGKSTQLGLVKNMLEHKGFKVLSLREPGGTQLSEDIRNILLSNKSKINDVAELLLFEAARTNLVEELIKPALLRNEFVLCDRFYDSTTAYQGYGRMIDIDLIKTCNRIAVNGLKPDLTFYLKIPLEIAKQRSKNREHDRIEKAGDDFFERVLAGYDQIAAEEPDRFRIINSESTIDVTKNKIFENIPALST
jgi:dTMP kinase